MFRIRLAQACAFGLVVAVSQSVHAQVAHLGEQTLRGTVQSVSEGCIVIENESGTVFNLKIQVKGDNSVVLTGGQRVRFPATIKVTGQFGIDSLQKGQQVRLRAQLNRLGRPSGPISEIQQLDTDDKLPGVEADEQPPDARTHVPCTIVGTFSQVVNGRLLVKIPRNQFTRKTPLSFELGEDVSVRFESDDYRHVGPGVRVERALLARMSTGDLVVKELEIHVAETTTADSRVDEEMLDQYKHLSDEPQPARVVRSPHFLFTTDISDRQAKILLDELETMIALMTDYFGRPTTGTIHGYVVRNLSQWPASIPMDPMGIAKIREGAGVCVSLVGGNQARTVLYSCAKHGIVQHEAAHAYCIMAFGSTGPTWLAEGVAEMCQYWTNGKTAVNADPIVIRYIQNSNPKRTLAQIAVPGREPAGGWQDYAWRWALCHLLASNPNYADRFKPLAIALMSGQPNASFASAYGPVAKEISFEYDLFLESLDNGYEARLCAWQWGRKFVPLRRDSRGRVTVAANYGWQPSGIKLSAGQSYDAAAEGEWKLLKQGTACSANGDSQGQGRLMGAIFNDYKLSTPIELGTRKSFVAPVHGDLYLRCRDDWHKLADNNGELTVHLRISP